MAIRFSQNDINAIKAAQAIRDYNDAAMNLNNRAIANQAAQAKQSQGGLGGVLAGIGESLGNVGRGLMGVFGNPVANLRDVLAGKDVNSEDSETQKYYKFLYGGENAKDRYAKAGGTGLDAAATLLDLVPVVGAAAGSKAAKLATKIAANPATQIAQGAASGLAQEYIDNGQNANMNNALIRAAAGTGAAGAGQAVGSKIAGKIPGNGKISKALNSNIGRGALTGAASGAVGGGLGTALYGGDLGQTLAGALQGAGGGALGGGAMAGTMGLLGTGIDKITGKKNTGVVNNTPSGAIAKKATVQPEAPARRGIAITDYDAGEQRVNVRRPNAPTNEYNLGKNAGSNIDGILGPNNARKLRNATQPTDADLLRKQTGGLYDNAADMLYKYPQELETLKKSYPEVYNAVRNGAKEYSDFNVLQFDGTDATGKASLPELNRQQYYEDTIGKLGSKGNGNLRAADVPDYMHNHLRNDTTGQLNGRTLRNDEILREFFRGKYGDAVDDMDMNELYGHYEDLAQAANQNETYTGENMKGGILLNDINDDVTGAFVNDLGLRRNIEVGGEPGLRQNIDVAIMDSPSNETVYSKRVIAPKAQAEQNLPATRGETSPAVQAETPLIQKGTPEYEAIKQQEYIDNRRRELRNIVTDGIRSQYGTIRLNDRINGLDDAIMELAGYGLTKRSQIDGFAKRITGADGAMSKAIRKAMNDSGKTSGRIDIDMQEVYRQAGASGNKAAMDKIYSRFNSMGKKYTVDADGNMNRSDMYDFGRELEREGYRMIERGGRTQNADTEVYGEAMRMLGENYIAKATDGVNMGKYIDANKLKNLLPGNEAWAAHVDESVPNIKTVSDARSFMAAPTKLSLLADAAEYNKGTYGANVGNLAKDGTQAIRAMTSANPARAAVQYAGAKAVNSNVVKDRVVKNALKKYNNIEAGGTGRLGEGAGKIAGGIGNKISGVTKALNNDTLQNMRFRFDTDNYLPSAGDVVARQTARQAGLAAYDDVALANEQNNAQGAYNDAYNNYANALNNYEMAAAQAQQATNPGTQQLQTISDAMDRALAAGDMTAYGQLADLYKKAYSIYGATTATAEPKALSATQSKALTASQQLDQLAQMTPGAGTALANSPLGFLVNLGGGDQYANQAKALATTLGYLLSGANIRETEAERIGQAYVPSAFDSEPVRQQKLARARQLIQSYMGSTDDLTQA